MTASFVMHKNKDAVLSNCISFALWYQRPYITTLRSAAEYTAEGAYLSKDITYENALKYFEAEWSKIYNSVDLLNRMITRIRKTYVRPEYKTNAQFVCGEYDSDVTSVTELFDVLHRIGC